MLDGEQGGSTTVLPPMDGGEPLVPATKPPVLMVLHQRHSNPGHIGQWFRNNGHALDLRRHFDGEPLPSTLANHCGAVIFGGPQSANDSLAYIRDEIDWIGVALDEKKPFLGVCLGAQMLAQKLGGQVDHCCHANVEIGYHPVWKTPAGDVLGPLPDHVYQWHREGFELPSDARLLATSNGPYPNQAFSYGPAAFGLQFHPEITHAQVNRWSGSNPMRLLMRGAKARQQHIDGHLVWGPQVRLWLDQFLQRWVGGRIFQDDRTEPSHKAAIPAPVAAFRVW